MASPLCRLALFTLTASSAWPAAAQVRQDVQPQEGAPRTGVQAGQRPVDDTAGGRLAPIPGEARQTEPPREAMSGQPAIRARGLSPADIELLNRLHGIDQQEIEAGTLARAISPTAQVRSYGEMLARGHWQTEAALRAVASERGVQLGDPTPEDGVDEEELLDQRATLDRLRTLQGAEFDREFLSAAVGWHDAAIRRVQAAHNGLQRPEVQELLGRLQPMLEHHRDVGAQLAAELNAPR
jgi:putative membrane protein